MNFIKKIIKTLLAKNYFSNNILEKVKTYRLNKYYKKMSKKVPVDEKMVIFEAFFAKKYACSPKAIYEYMLSDPKYKDFKFVWVFRDIDDPEIKKIFKGKRTILLRYKTKKYYRFYARAKYWVTNARVPDCIVKKPEQVYIQCWHGTPLKKLGWDIEVKGNNAMSSNKEVRRQYNHDASRYTYMLSPSRFCSEKLTSAFNLKALGKENIIVEKGYPRNDELFTFDNDKVNAIKDELGIPRDKKVILYAPTWRDNQHKLGVGYTFDIGIDLKKLKTLYGDEYVILMRMHYLIANQMNLHGVSDFAVDVSSYNNVNDLYIISDILITDYSSVFFDYANLKRPILFYMYDLDTYQNNTRDFYISLDELPGPIIKEADELSDAIGNIDSISEQYKEKYKAFNDKFNYLDDADSSKRVVETCIK
ncbi:MAG: CDP-glycerol glycerophosphotransferase family protein [Eubacterium sp.]|nr:CDP-glycerol glycerophosphotransferase family protein [Eubacterium sp.]